MATRRGGVAGAGLGAGSPAGARKRSLTAQLAKISPPAVSSHCPMP